MCGGWICERHRDQPFPHDECGGPGMPCEQPECPLCHPAGWVDLPDVPAIDRHCRVPTGIDSLVFAAWPASSSGGLKQPES